MGSISEAVGGISEAVGGISEVVGGIDGRVCYYFLDSCGIDSIRISRSG